nr:hypothetical protein [Acidobacteriota bacterium]
AVVTDGRFTNVYVFPDPDRETWEQHMAKVRPADGAQFSRAAIDAFTEALMAPGWPSYFDSLYQYSGIHPPRFFGSAVASRTCVDAALKDAKNGVVQWDTVRSLSNCHIDGRDPSPQVNLIFSPDIKLAAITVASTGGEMCTTTPTRAWHAWGINTPNFTAMPTSVVCAQNFGAFTTLLSHEIVETLSDPGGLGMGIPGKSVELGDNCQKRKDGFGTWNGNLAVARYWSNFDNNCQPRLDPPAGSVSQTWVLGQGSPLKRLTGGVHTLTLGVPPSRVVTDAAATQVLLVVQTGDDDLRGGGANDNADATLTFAGGSRTTVNINQSRGWANGTTHSVSLALPPQPVKVSDITGVTISTRFGGGVSGDNWNIDKAALIVAFPSGSPTRTPKPVVAHDWLDASGAPLVRFTGDLHDRSLPVKAQDGGSAVSALNVIISTGNDDLRGGGKPGDNCDVFVDLTGGRTIVVRNVNGGRTWDGWSIHTVSIPLPAGGLRGGDVLAVRLHTGFGGGLGGDNWNVNRVQLRATLQ